MNDSTNSNPSEKSSKKSKKTTYLMVGGGAFALIMLLGALSSTEDYSSEEPECRRPTEEERAATRPALKEYVEKKIAERLSVDKEFAGKTVAERLSAAKKIVAEGLAADKEFVEKKLEEISERLTAEEKVMKKIVSERLSETLAADKEFMGGSAEEFAKGWKISYPHNRAWKIERVIPHREYDRRNDLELLYREEEAKRFGWEKEAKSLAKARESSGKPEIKGDARIVKLLLENVEFKIWRYDGGGCHIVGKDERTIGECIDKAIDKMSKNLESQMRYYTPEDFLEGVKRDEIRVGCYKGHPFSVGYPWEGDLMGFRPDREGRINCGVVQMGSPSFLWSVLPGKVEGTLRVTLDLRTSGYFWMGSLFYSEDLFKPYPGRSNFWVPSSIAMDNSFSSPDDAWWWKIAKSTFPPSVSASMRPPLSARREGAKEWVFVRRDVEVTVNLVDCEVDPESKEIIFARCCLGSGGYFDGDPYYTPDPKSYGIYRNSGRLYGIQVERENIKIVK